MNPNPNLEPILYVHIKHPSTMWLFESAYNYMCCTITLLLLMMSARYGHTRDHVAVQKLGGILKHPPKNAKINKIATPIKPAMPEHCKIPVMLQLS